MNTTAHSDLSPEFLALANTLNHAVLIETLRAAAFYVHYSDSNPVSRVTLTKLREAKSCYFFVEGTGLNLLLNRLSLAYNPDTLRDTFNYCVRRSV